MSGVWTVVVEEQLRTLIAKVADLEFKHKGMEQWHNELQKRIAALKGQAVQMQATEHLYAPLRSDTRPLLQMSAFVRNLAMLDLRGMDDIEAYGALAKVVFEAAELVKRHT